MPIMAIEEIGREEGKEIKVKVKNRSGRIRWDRRVMALTDSLVILLFSFLLIVHIGGGEEWSGEEECRKPLGMESQKIPESQITASSSYDEKSVGPQNARIRLELNGGAWCPKVWIQQGIKEYLEIDFAGEYRVTQTETQGRFGNGVGVEYVEKYQLEYWRDSLSGWVPYKDYLGRTIFDGNANTYLEVKQELIPPIIASRIRFIPHSIHPRTICMRVEVYGCHYTDGVVHYEAPQGYYKKNPEVDFRDMFYDGREDDFGVLQSGLGLLTDTLFGPNDFTTPHKTRGNSWIGWENQSTPIKIGFQFDQLRKFQQVSIHVNNFVSHGAQVFASVNIYFSVDGIKFSEYPISWSPKKDLKNDTALLERIPLKGRVGSHIRLEFFHSNQWLLLSEISFRSDIFTGNLSDAIQSMNWNQEQEDPDGQFSQKNKSVTTDGSSEHSTGAIIGLAVGSVSVCLLLSVVSAACFVMRRNRRNTKLVGIMGMGMTPKSMSVGLGLNSCPSNDQLSTSTNTTKTNSKKPSGGSSSSSTFTLNGGTSVGSKKMGKIALCDMKPVSISGETDSDESLYHELVFGRNGPSVLLGKSGTSSKSKKNGGGGLSYSSLGIANSSVGSSCTSSKTESDSGYGSTSQQLARKNCGIGNSRKIKYQKVNHGGDFNDVMGVHGIDNEMTYYHTHNQNLTGHFQPSSPSTPSGGGLRSGKLPLGQSLGSIPLSSLATSVHIPPSPPPAFRIPFLSQHPQISYANTNAPPSHNLHNNHSHNHLTLGPKSMSSCNNNGGHMIMSSTTNRERERSTNSAQKQGFFNSPRANNRRNSSNNNNHPSSGINTISAALSAHNGNSTLLSSLSNGNSNNLVTNNTLLLQQTGNNSNSFGISLMKSSGGLSTSSSTNPSNSLSSTPHHLLANGGPLGICGGESNYYAATDIFQVSDKHFDRF